MGDTITFTAPAESDCGSKIVLTAHVTPSGVTGFVGASNEPVPLRQDEVNRLLHREQAERPRSRAQFSIGETVKVVSGPLSDFSGEISEVNEDAQPAQPLARPRGNLQTGPFETFAIESEKMIDQRRDVFGPFAQRRDVNRHDV